MAFLEKRLHVRDRRRAFRGGRRPTDRPGRFPSILVADSFDGVRIPCVRYLDRFHFDVVEAATGEEAIARMAEGPPHLILAESTLPTMPIERLTQWLSQNWRMRHVPVIVLVSDIDPGAPHPLVDPRVAGFLTKPFGLDRMVHEIRRVLRASPLFA